MSGFNSSRPEFSSGVAPPVVSIALSAIHPVTDLLLHGNSVNRFNLQQLGNSPNHIILKFVHVSIGKYQFPKSFNGCNPLVPVHHLLECRREAVKINGFMISLCRGFKNFRKFPFGQVIVPSEDLQHLFTFFRKYLTVSGDHMEHQGSFGQPCIIGRKKFGFGCLTLHV